jgi:hypothetical protein
MGVVSGILLASKIEDLKGDGVPFVPWIWGEMMDDNLDINDIGFFLLTLIIFVIIAIWLDDWLSPRLQARIDG